MNSFNKRTAARSRRRGSDHGILRRCSHRPHVAARADARECVQRRPDGRVRLAVVRHRNHEKWDGSGYPRKPAGGEIPLAARIFAVADVFDALSSRRPYKEPMGFETTMSILAADTGSQFDARVMAAFRPIARPCPCRRFRSSCRPSS
ncbi:hypothetical protein with response regulator domain [Aromatoleum aromaticum EbN1]|uniref:HD-GYP domain-containing protein n=1 Tax=Aromatoleum aromaticum (strain DSM 19018 / LMG 30748 / EbN1) TaxID=76114 RepID=Q5P437_AROAE|nr:hypothetical protein with response regulator domain [Aromatoleum aromaticum EbN1]